MAYVGVDQNTKDAFKEYTGVDIADLPEGCDLFLKCRPSEIIKALQSGQDIQLAEKTSTIPCTKKDEFEVTPYSVTGNVDYGRLVKSFGTELIDDELLERFKKVSGQELHPFFRRKIFFSHRKLADFLDAYERGDPVFLYTGRGPSTDSMHFGHTISFIFTAYLQKVFKCPCVIQMSDSEKYYAKDLTLEETLHYGRENARDIIAFGFDPDLTFIFSDYNYRQEETGYEAFVTQLKNLVRIKDVQSSFGFDGETNVGMTGWPLYQSAAAFSKSFKHIFGNKTAHCLVAYAIDQDPYFRLARDIAERMGLPKPCSIMCTFVPPLTGAKDGKMSSSVGTGATLFLTDSRDVLVEKIKKNAFSGGAVSAEEHRKNGGDPESDMSIKYLEYLLDDDAELEDIREKYRKGELLSGEVKEFMANKMADFFEKHQAEREKVTDEVLDEFYKMKPMNLPEPVQLEKTTAEEQLHDDFDALEIKTSTKYHKPTQTLKEVEGLETTLDGVIPKVMLLKVKGSDEHHMYLSLRDERVNHDRVKELAKCGKTRVCTLDETTALLGDVITPLALKDEVKVKSVVLSEEVARSNLNVRPFRNDATMTISVDDLTLYLSSVGCNVFH